ncbi:hypothetical protein LCGC14_1555510 [marine sediment metagenome]|uniref:Uncharacterized protein n=1 Tax=marine sediment metagenome TaxID=412755 RepID=A0A0F9JA15_9ZZZZ
MPNDSKYIRLYPERAVAPLRAVFDRLIQGEVVPTPELATARLTLDEDGFPEDEPLFLLRGQDTLAPLSVRGYAMMAQDAGAFGGSVEVYEHIRDFADRMERWEPRKLPD